MAKIIENIMTILDEHKQSINENIYLKLCSSLKKEYDDENKNFLCKLTYIKIKYLYKGDCWVALPIIHNKLVNISPELFDKFLIQQGIPYQNYNNSERIWLAENDLSFFSAYPDDNNEIELFSEQENCCSQDKIYTIVKNRCTIISLQKIN